MPSTVQVPDRLEARFGLGTRLGFFEARVSISDQGSAHIGSKLDSPLGCELSSGLGSELGSV